MKVLFIGGTGNISTSSSIRAAGLGIDLYVLNRGQRSAQLPESVVQLTCDINDPKQSTEVLKDHTWDSVVNWIAFTPDQIERDIRLFRGKTKQYIFISSASAYQSPPSHPVITESTPLHNPYWEYSRNKIACEEALMDAYRNENFPITIVRPSHTYDSVIPVSVGNWDYTPVARMKAGKKIIVHGDGSSLWVVTHSEDFGKGFVGLLGKPQTIGHAFHITTDEVLTWNQMYQIVAEVFEVDLDIVHIPTDFINKMDPDTGAGLLGDKAASVIFDNSKIKMFVPEFKATISYAEGMRRTREWFLADPSRMELSDHSQKSSSTMDDIISAYLKAWPV